MSCNTDTAKLNSQMDNVNFCHRNSEGSSPTVSIPLNNKFSTKYKVTPYNRSKNLNKDAVNKFHRNILLEKLVYTRYY